MIGPLLLLASQLTDLWAFLKTSTSTNKKYFSDDIFVIDSNYFVLFYKMLVKVDLYSKQDNMQVNAKDLIE